MNSGFKQTAMPSDQEIEGGLTFRFLLNDSCEVSGDIFGDGDAVRWHYTIEPSRSPYSPLNLLRKPDFVLHDRDDRAVLRILRAKRFPLRFEMIQNGALVGTILRRSPLRNRYTLAFKDGPTWNFHMPAFTVLFCGQSNDAARLWVHVGPKKRQWNLLVEPGANDLRLIAGLAFIHREWWCYS